MQAHMMGSYNLSFYKLRNKYLSLVEDSKSRTSFYYHLPAVGNWERGHRHRGFLRNEEANTYQTYLFMITAKTK